MDSVELGRRIKEARLKKKMTQAELVGDFITRNMLSGIESGNATPSVKTLEYIADKLDLSVSALLPDEDDRLLDTLIDAKGMLAAGEYTRAAELVKSCETLLFDEYAAISSMAYLGMGKELEKDGDLGAAIDAYKAACELSDKGIYANMARKSEAALGLVRVSQSVVK